MLESTWLGIDEQRAHLSERLGSRALSDLSSGTIVVVPSISFPISELRKIVGIQHYEERLLFMTLILRNPGVQIVFVTSTPVDEAVVSYYLSFLPDPADARRRLHMIALEDARPDPLSLKLLGRRDVVEEIKTRLTQPAYAMSFNVTEVEWELTDELGVVLYGPHPDLVWLGSKSGSRRIAEKAGVPVLEGAEDLSSVDEVERAIGALAARGKRSAVIKLNNGFSGQGNAIVPLDTFVSPLRDSPVVFCAAEESWNSYGQKIAAEGAIVEELLRTPGVVSPSVQMRVGADGFVEVVSTHDQILGGPDDQVYLGCRFPARRLYRQEIQHYGRRIANVLAEKGVVGSFGIDFVVDPESGEAYMSEINLRLGGTSHPFYMARFATQGVYDETAGHLVAGGRPKYYVASDNLKSPRYVGIEPGTVIEALTAKGLAYDPVTKTGITLHLLGALRGYGKLGCLAIGDSRAEADELFGEVEPLLDGLG